MRIFRDELGPAYGRTNPTIRSGLTKHCLSWRSIHTASVHNGKKFNQSAYDHNRKSPKLREAKSNQRDGEDKQGEQRDDEGVIQVVLDVEKLL